MTKCLEKLWRVLRADLTNLDTLSTLFDNDLVKNAAMGFDLGSLSGDGLGGKKP